MAEIFLTPEILRDKASQVNNAQAEQENMLNTIQTVVDDILANWEGKAKDAFLAAFDAKKGTYKEFGVDMSQFSQFLVDYSNHMEDIDLGERDKIGTI